MKRFVTFCLATNILFAVPAVSPSYAIELRPSSGSTSKIPRQRTPRPPVVRADRADRERYRPPVVLLPEGKGSKAYDRYVEREFKRDRDGGYVGYRRNKPRDAAGVGGSRSF